MKQSYTTFSVIWILLSDVGNKCTRLGIESLEELSSLRKQRLRNLARIMDQHDVVLCNDMPLGSCCATTIILVSFHDSDQKLRSNSQARIEGLVTGAHPVR